MNKSDQFPEMDASGIPTPVCPMCGCVWLVIPVRFCQDSYNISMWATEGTCLDCKSKITACTPLDLPDAWKQ
jgi:hypothetical protein